MKNFNKKLDAHDYCLDLAILDLLKDCMTRDDIPLDIKEKIVRVGRFNVAKMNQESFNITIVHDYEGGKEHE